jgi:hypothetical protein
MALAGPTLYLTHTAIQDHPFMAPRGKVSFEGEFGGQMDALKTRSGLVSNVCRCSRPCAELHWCAPTWLHSEPLRRCRVQRLQPHATGERTEVDIEQEPQRLARASRPLRHAGGLDLDPLPCTRNMPHQHRLAVRSQPADLGQRHAEGLDDMAERRDAVTPHRRACHTVGGRDEHVQTRVDGDPDLSGLRPTSTPAPASCPPRLCHRACGARGHERDRDRSDRRGLVTLYPDFGLRPNASNPNVAAGETVPNLVQASSGTTGIIDFWKLGSSGSTDLILDAFGHYQAGRRNPPLRTPSLDGALPPGPGSVDAPCR